MIFLKELLLGLYRITLCSQEAFVRKS